MQTDPTTRIPTRHTGTPLFFYGGTVKPVSPAARYFQDTRRDNDRPTMRLMLHTDDAAGRPPVVPGFDPPTEQFDPMTERVSPAPHWADLLAEHGYNPQVHQDLAVQHGWPLPGQEPERPSRMLIYTLVGLIVLVLVLFGVFLRSKNFLPTGVPILGKDSGVAACQAIAAGATPTGTDADKEFTAADYRRARQVFADSRYPAIRDNGTRLMDLAWQIQGAGTSDDDMAGALMFLNSLSQAYTGLAGGCADHGITIPAMTGGN